MKVTEVQYSDGEFDLVFHIKEADGYAGIKFSALQTKASAEVGPGEGPERQAEWAVCVWNWPACMASTEKVTGKGSEKVNAQMSVKDFLALPWNLIRAWESAAVEVNPTFSPFWNLRKKTVELPESG